jgi:hypothetical protein
MYNEISLIFLNIKEIEMGKDKKKDKKEKKDKKKKKQKKDKKK